MNWNKEIENICKWIKLYVQKSGTNGIAIGSSGGIDSSVVLWLCSKSIPKKNILSIYMPCYSSPDSGIDAKLLVKNLNINFIEIPIITIYNETLSVLNLKKENKNYNLAQANLKARIRMNILYSNSNILNFLVCGTSNKSELEIGYATKYGDLAVDIEPLANYFKTEIYKMAKLMPEIPESIKIKEPSADLWENQKDSDEIGFTYQELDPILKAIENGNNKQLDKIDIKKITKIQNMIKSSIHKNNMPPRYERI